MKTAVDIRKVILTIVLQVLAFMAPVAVMAQTDAQFSQYYDVKNYYNPAASGCGDMLNVSVGSRLQWTGIPDAPKTFAALADMPLPLLDRRLGAGLVIRHESMGLYRGFIAAMQLSYRMKLWGGELSLGLQGGMLEETFKGSEVVLPDDDDFHEGGDDAVPRTDISGSSADIGAGVFYSSPRFWAGVSVSHVNNPSVTMTEGADREWEYEAGRTFYFMAGGNIPVKNTLFEIQPSVMVKSDFTFTTGEITARARYNKFITVGAGYRYRDAVTFIVGAEYRNFHITYSYDYATSAIAKAADGSHEIWAGYSVRLDFGRKNKYRHKSIRIM